MLAASTRCPIHAKPRPFLNAIVGDGNSAPARFWSANGLAAGLGRPTSWEWECPICDIQQLALYFCWASFLPGRWPRAQPRRPLPLPCPQRRSKRRALRCALPASAMCRDCALVWSAATEVYANACARIAPSYPATALQRERACAVSGPPRRRRTKVKAALGHGAGFLHLAQVGRNLLHSPTYIRAQPPSLNASTGGEAFASQSILPIRSTICAAIYFVRHCRWLKRGRSSTVGLRNENGRLPSAVWARWPQGMHTVRHHDWREPRAARGMASRPSAVLGVGGVSI